MFLLPINNDSTICFLYKLAKEICTTTQDKVRNLSEQLKDVCDFQPLDTIIEHVKKGIKYVNLTKQNYTVEPNETPVITSSSPADAHR